MEMTPPPLFKTYKKTDVFFRDDVPNLTNFMYSSNLTNYKSAPVNLLYFVSIQNLELTHVCNNNNALLDGRQFDKIWKKSLRGKTINKSSTRSGAFERNNPDGPLYPMESMIEVEMESNSFCKFAPNLRSWTNFISNRCRQFAHFSFLMLAIEQ